MKRYIPVIAIFILGMMVGYVLPRPHVEALDGGKASFDDSNCQYPGRPSNVNRCDNSDPAVPQCVVKFQDEQACIAKYAECLKTMPYEECVAQDKPETHEKITKKPVTVPKKATISKGTCYEDR